MTVWAISSLAAHCLGSAYLGLLKTDFRAGFGGRDDDEDDDEDEDENEDDDDDIHVVGMI